MLGKYRRWLLKTASELAPRRPNDWLDLAQEGWVAMWRALRSFDPARGAEVTYLQTAARMRMVECLRRSLWTGTPGARGHIRETPATPVDPDWDWVDEAVSAAALCQDLDEAYHRGEILAAINRLTPTQRQYVYLRFWLGYRQSELADIFGCNPRLLWDASTAGAKYKLRAELEALAS